MHMDVMGKTKTRSLPENTALSAEQQDEFNTKVKNIKQKVSFSKVISEYLSAHVYLGS